MKYLNELTEVITKNKIKRIDILGNSANHQSNIQTLYEGIISGELREEEVAKAFFYGGSDHKDMYFGRLKRNLFRRLTNTLFFIDVNQPEYSDLQRAYYNCYREFAVMKILLGRGVRKSAILVGERLLKKAKEFDFTHLVVETTRTLRVHFGSITGDRKLFLQYNEICKKYQKVLFAESQAEEYYVDLASYFAKSSATKSDLADLAKEYSEELKKIALPLRSRQFDFMAYYVHILRFEVVNDYKNLLLVCEEAVQLFETHHQHAQKTIVFTFRLKKLACQIQVGAYEAGEETVNACLSMQIGWEINWLALQHYHLILLFHAQKWQKAYEVLQQVKSQPFYKKMPENLRETWRVHEAFVQFLISANKVQLSEKQGVRKFRIQKFLNEVPTYAKDKRGNNITIIILQILFLLQQKKQDAVLDKVESLNVYCHRYLRKDDTFRSNCFIKMLMVLPQAYFNRVAAIRKTKKLRKKLAEQPLETANQSSELEIVPYEVLWELVLEIL